MKNDQDRQTLIQLLEENTEIIYFYSNLHLLNSNNILLQLQTTYILRQSGIILNKAKYLKFSKVIINSINFDEDIEYYNNDDLLETGVYLLLLNSIKYIDIPEEEFLKIDNLLFCDNTDSCNELSNLYLYLRMSSNQSFKKNVNKLYCFENQEIVTIPSKILNYDRIDILRKYINNNNISDYLYFRNGIAFIQLFLITNKLP